MLLVPITNPTDQRLALYANMRDAELAQRADPTDPRAHGGCFIAEGELVVGRLIQSRFPVRSVLTTEARLATLGPMLAGVAESVPVYLVDQPTMNGVVGFNMHRGVLAIGERSDTPSLADLLARPGPLIILEDTNNNDNLGAIFRNAAGLGGPGCSILLSPRCADPLYRKSLRVSMGAVLSVPFARSIDWIADLASVRAAGFRLLGLTPRPEAVDITRLPTPTKRTALLLGAEGPGLTDRALASCDATVRIPMRPAGHGVNSLNVAMAAGIALHAIGAQSDPPR